MVRSVTPKAVVNKIDGAKTRNDADVVIRSESLCLHRERLDPIHNYEQVDDKELDDEVPQLGAVHIEEDTGTDGSGDLGGNCGAVVTRSESICYTLCVLVASTALMTLIVYQLHISKYLIFRTMFKAKYFSPQMEQFQTNFFF
jgi:hypothetical protein